MQRPPQTRRGVTALIGLGAHNPEKHIAGNYLTPNCGKLLGGKLGRGFQNPLRGCVDAVELGSIREGGSLVPLSHTLGQWPRKLFA